MIYVKLGNCLSKWFGDEMVMNGLKVIVKWGIDNER